MLLFKKLRRGFVNQGFSMTRRERGQPNRDLARQMLGGKGRGDVQTLKEIPKEAQTNLRGAVPTYN